MIKTIGMRLLKKNNPDKSSHERRELLAPDEMMNFLLSYYLKMDNAGKEKMAKRFRVEDSHLYPMDEKSFDEMLEEDYRKWKYEFEQAIPGVLKKIDDDDLDWELATPWWKQVLVEAGLMKR